VREIQTEFEGTEKLTVVGFAARSFVFIR